MNFTIPWSLPSFTPYFFAGSLERWVFRGPKSQVAWKKIGHKRRSRYLTIKSPKSIIYLVVSTNPFETYIVKFSIISPRFGVNIKKYLKTTNQIWVCHGFTLSYHFQDAPCMELLATWTRGKCGNMFPTWSIWVMNGVKWEPYKWGGLLTPFTHLHSATYSGPVTDSTTWMSQEVRIKG